MHVFRVNGQPIAILSKQELFQRQGAIRFLVFWRDGFRCAYCGRSRFEDKVLLNVDHVIPAHEGGAYAFENLVTACAECNYGKGGYHLPRNIRQQMADATKANSRDFEQLTGITIPPLLYDGEVSHLEAESAWDDGIIEFS